MLTQPPVPQFNEGRKLLRPVAWHTAANSENSQALLPQQGRRKVLQVLEGIKAQFVPPGGLTDAIVQGQVQAEFGIGKGGYEHRHAFLVS